MSYETITIAQAFACVLGVIDRFDQRRGVAGDSCAEYVLERCEPLICEKKLATLEHPRAYLVRTAQRVCARYFRRKRKITLVLLPNGTADIMTSVRLDPCQIIWEALSSLQDELTHRERICGESLAAGSSKKKIAQHLGICPSAVTRLSKQVQLKIKQRITEQDAIH